MPGEAYDFVLLFNISSHSARYDFSDVGELKGYKFCFIDSSEYGWWTHYSHYKELFGTSFTAGSMAAKPFCQQVLKQFLDGKSYPYIVREFYKGIDYPNSYHPIDYPLYGVNTPIPPMATFEEYCARPNDVYVGWGESHPSRKDLARVVSKLPLKVVVNSGNKLPQNEYFTNMLNARMTVAYDGYGSGSFREKEALARTMLFRNNMAIIQNAPLTSGQNFVEYQVQEKLVDWDKDSKYSAPYKNFRDKHPVFESTNLGSIMLEWIQDLEGMYRVYEGGYKHLMENFTEKAVAQYVLDILEGHDWDKPTPISFI
jgi:hypothetical protein